MIINAVRRMYPNVRFWAQSPHDQSYLKEASIEAHEMLPGGLDGFAAALDGGADLVTTRLHAALFGLRQGVRTTLFSLDGRIERTAGPVGVSHFAAPKSVQDVIDTLNRYVVTTYEPRVHDVRRWREANSRFLDPDPG